LSLLRYPVEKSSHSFFAGMASPGSVIDSVKKAKKEMNSVRIMTEPPVLIFIGFQQIRIGWEIRASLSCPLLYKSALMNHTWFYYWVSCFPY